MSPQPTPRDNARADLAWLGWGPEAASRLGLPGSTGNPDTSPPADLAPTPPVGELAGQPAAQSGPTSADVDQIGRVVRLDRGEVTVARANNEVRAFTPGARSLAVGDWVRVAQRDGQDANWTVTTIASRWSTLARRAAGEALEAQVVATNVDVVLCVHSLTRPLNRRRIERELVTAHAAPAHPIIVLTKADLVSKSASKQALRVARSAASDSPVVVTSATRGDGIDELVTALASAGTTNPTIVMLGSSGVGKSRLLNALTGAALAAVGDVRESDQKGRHTTTHASLFPLPDGGVIIDTPGIRALGLWDAEGAIEAAFGDIMKLASECRFRDCRHIDEPGCAVTNAVDAGTLAPDRLGAYLTLAAELVALDRAKDEQRWSRGEGGRPRPARAARTRRT